jgi:hypothetical protein
MSGDFDNEDVLLLMVKLLTHIYFNFILLFTYIYLYILFILFKFAGDLDIDVFHDNDEMSDKDLMQSPFTDSNPVRLFRNQILETNMAPLRVYINRMQQEFASDVLSIYNKPNPRFKSDIRVHFDNENGLGEGPVRECFSMPMGLIQNGFPIDSDQNKMTLIFEGQEDHTLPRPDAILWRSGFYRSVGRMIAHSFLHRGPPLLWYLSCCH